VTKGKVGPADLVVVVYDITALVPTDDYDTVVVATKSIEPTTWSAVGGPGACAVWPPAKALVIAQMPAVHRQIQDWLRRQRQPKNK
jgi:hypothetical protein